MKYIPKYCIMNYDGKILVRSKDHVLKLATISDKDLYTSKDVCYFKSQEAAENYIWKYGYLDSDPTLRPFQI